MQIEKVTFPNHKNEKLAGFLHLPSSSSENGIVLSHCFTCSRHISILKDIGMALAEKGFLALRFDFSGNGQSEGNFSDTGYTKHTLEIERAMRFLKDRGATKIGLAGHSMGGTLSLICTARHPDIRAVCIIGTGDRLLYPEKFLQESEQTVLKESGETSFVSRGRHLSIHQQFFDDAALYDLKTIVTELKQPLLIIHSEQDEIIPVAAAKNLFDLKKGPRDLFILPEGDHMFVDKAVREKTADTVSKWFETQFST